MITVRILLGVGKDSGGLIRDAVVGQVGIYLAREWEAIAAAAEGGWGEE